MKKIWALVADTFREIYARKVILGIIIIEALVVIGTILILSELSSEEAELEARQQGDSALVIADEGAGPRSPETDSLLNDFDSTAGGSDTLSKSDTLSGTDTLVRVDTLSNSDTTSAATAPSSTFRTPPPSRDGAVPDARNGKTEAVSGQLGAFSGLLIVAVFMLAIFATAGIVPSMMEKGTIDLVLSKPIPRTTLLFGRALGGVAAVTINLIPFVAVIWALYGSYTGVWYLPFLIWTPIIALFGYLVIYSFILLVNVVAESWILPLILVYIHVVVLSPLLTNRESTVYTWTESPIVRTIADGLYYILPQANDYLQQVTQVVYTNTTPDAGPFIQGAIFMIAMLSLAAWRFERKDF